MKKLLLLSALITSLISFPVHADIYKCTGDSGIPAFVDGKTKAGSNYKNCILFIRDESVPAPSRNSDQANRPSRTKTPSDFPRVDAQTQNKRDDKRKEILLQELEAERQALEEAKKAKLEGASKPEVYRGANGKTFRNVPKFEEKMQRLQSDVEAHENNIELLQKELDSVK
jgi:hypothetical protein